MAALIRVCVALTPVAAQTTMVVYHLNLRELLELSQTVPSLLTKANNTMCGQPVVCIYKKDFEDRIVSDLGTMEYIGRKVKLKGVGGKVHEDGPEGEVFVKTYTQRKTITRAKRPCQ